MLPTKYFALDLCKIQSLQLHIIMIAWCIIHTSFSQSYANCCIIGSRTVAVFLTLLPVVMKIISYSSDPSSLSSTLTHKLIVTISTLHLSVYNVINRLTTNLK